MFDMLKIMNKLKEAKKRMKVVKTQLEQKIFEQQSDDMLITVEVSASKTIKSININPNLLASKTKDNLEQKIIQTLNEALQKAEEYSKQEMKKVMDDVIPGASGLGIKPEDLNGI